ncbi:MAG: hypothetical protein QXI19_02660 [Candidatus Caldarchaeum sp.]
MVAVLRVPEGWAEVGSIGASIGFLSLPILTLYFGAMIEMRVLSLVGIMGGGLAGVGVSQFLLRQALSFWLRGCVVGASQVFTVLWAWALGCLVGRLLRDKNIVLPAAAVLATADVILVWAPVGPIRQFLSYEAGQRAFEAVAYQVPRFGQALELPLSPVAYVGPADFVFIAMFFGVIHRFGMQGKKTLLWLVPTLAAYLVVVIGFGDRTVLGISLATMPALLPIGVVVVLVNRREFDLSAGEKWLTVGVVLMCVILMVVAFSFAR